MTTEAKVHANRLNAQRSTGPRTPQGKAAVSQNALKHGLAARRDVVITESQEEFDLHRASLLAELDPKTPMESMLADRIVSLSWRLKRADQIQNQTFDAMHEDNTHNSLANIAKSLGLKGLGLLQPDPADSNPDLILGRIALKDFSNARVLDRLLMYERRIEHSLFKTILELQRLRLLRDLEPENRRLAPGLVPAVTTEQDNNPNRLKAPPEQRRRNDIRLPRRGHPTHNIRLPQGANAQNKPNPENPRINATPATAKDYKQKPPRPSRKKQTQSNPTCRGEAYGEAGSNPIPRVQNNIRHTKYNPCTTAAQQP